jgi:hypothetical protein
MKQKSKRKYKKRRCTRRKMHGGESLDVYIENEEKKDELLEDPNVKNLLEEAKKEAEDEEISFNEIVKLAKEMGKTYADTVIAGAKANLAGLQAASAAASVASNMANNPDKLASQLGPFASQLGAKNLSNMANNPDKFASQLGPKLEGLESAKNLANMAKNPGKMANQLNTTLNDSLTNQLKQSGGNVPTPFIPLLKSKEANIIGGRIETSIKKFLG